jgi:hypothetical protein
VLRRENKASSTVKKRPSKLTASLICQKNYSPPAGLSTLVGEKIADWLPGFIGPVPPPLSIRARKSYKIVLSLAVDI